MIRAERGMDSPDKPSGYPVPSYFSWWYNAMSCAIWKYSSLSTPFRVSSKMRAPSTGCDFMIANSSSVSFPFFCKIESGMDIFPISCKCAASATISAYSFVICEVKRESCSIAWVSIFTKFPVFLMCRPVTPSRASMIVAKLPIKLRCMATTFFVFLATSVWRRSV